MARYGRSTLFFEKELKAFCTSLFTEVIGLEAVRSRIGEIDEHYREFVAVNVGGKCPYCGFGGIKGPHHSKREAYDHFLPKGTYPFNSVNFRNLAPMCHECNSSYKMSKDPTYHLDPIARTNGGGRRKAFYTYSATAPGIKIAVTLTTSDVTKLEPGEIDLQFAATGRDQELEAWKEVFGIEERYKAKLCGPNDGIAWLVKVLDECENYGSHPQELIAKERRYAMKSPFADSNFLRVPFLEACQTAGVFGGGD